MHIAKRIGLGIAAFILITACGHRQTVVLVPDPDGRVGQITVTNPAGSVEIDQANQATDVSSRESAPTAPVVRTGAEIDALFGDVLANQPLPPVHYILHFRSDSVELLPDSRRQLPQIVAAIADRAPTRVSVVGHTDTMGDKAYNLNLSLRRAKAVKALLVADGVDARFIDVTSHGEANPLVPTADNVANAQNRRVEVIVR